MLWQYFKDSPPHKTGTTGLEMSFTHSRLFVSESQVGLLNGKHGHWPGRGIFVSATEQSQALRFFWVHMVLVVWKRLEYTAPQQAVQSVQYGWSKQREQVQQSQTLFVGQTLTLELEIITNVLISFLF